MRLQNTQLRDQLEAIKMQVLMSNEIPREESIQLAKTIDSIQDDEMGRIVLKTIQESADWQTINPNRNNNSAEDIHLREKEGSTTMNLNTQISNITKHVNKDAQKDVLEAVDHLVESVRKEVGNMGLTELRTAIAADLTAAGEKINDKLDKVQERFMTPGQQATAIGWRTLEFFAKCAIGLGTVVLTAWFLKKMYEVATPAMVAVPV